MRIVCPRCATEYFLESNQLDRDGTPVQCSSCEHVFTVYPGGGSVGPEADSEIATAPAHPPKSDIVPPPPHLDTGKAQGLFLAQGDRIYKVRDIATLQRWVVEKRVLLGDRLSMDGKSWDVVSSRGDLRPFFAVIEQLKVTKRSLQRARKERDTLERETQETKDQSVGGAGGDSFAGEGLEFSDVHGTPAFRFADIEGSTQDAPARPSSQSKAPEIVVSSPSMATISSSAATPGALPQSAFQAPADPDPLHSATSGASASLASGILPVGAVASASGTVAPSDPRSAISLAATSPGLATTGASSSFPSMHDSISESISSPGIRSGLGFASEETADPSMVQGLIDDPELSKFFSGQAITADETPVESRQEPTRSPVSKITRSMPVADPTPHPEEVGAASARVDEQLRSTPHSPTPSGQGTGSKGATSARPSEDFDPNQTFSEPPQPRSRAFLYVLLVLLGLVVAYVIWAYNWGPEAGHDDFLYPDSATTDTTSGPSAPSTPAPEATPESDTTPESDMTPESDTTPDAEATPEPTPESMPERTPEPTPKPKSQATPKPKSQATLKPDRPKKPRTHSSTGHKLRGDAAWSQGDYPGAIAAYEKAIAASPKDITSTTRLGWAYIEVGKNSDAVKAFRTALGLNASKAEAHYGLGLAYQSLGRADAARDEYKQYLRLKPDGRDAAEVRAMLRSLD